MASQHSLEGFVEFKYSAHGTSLAAQSDCPSTALPVAANSTATVITAAIVEEDIAIIDLRVDDLFDL